MSVIQNLNHQAIQEEQYAKLPKEARETLEIFNRLETFTIEMSKKVLSEIETSAKNIHLKIDEI